MYSVEVLQALVGPLNTVDRLEGAAQSVSTLERGSPNAFGQRFLVERAALKLVFQRVGRTPCMCRS